MKKFIAIFLAILIAISSFTTIGEFSEKQITVTLNGKLISFDVQPVNIDGRVLVPVRAIFEALGATVEWNGAKNEAISTKGDTSIKLYKDNNTMYKNGQPITLDVPVKNIDGRILVPVRAISEAFGCNVDWDGAKSQVIIATNNSFIDKENSDKPEYVTLYALDGRSQVFAKSEVPAQLTVGWYEYPVVMMYALDGRTAIVYEQDIVANEKVGWYYGKPVTMYSADGRTLIVGENRVEEQKSVGWYTEPVLKMYAVENGNLKTINVLQSQVAANKKVGWRTDMPKSKVSTVTCDDCHGSGRRNCSYCDGLGFIRRFDGFLGDNNSGFNFFPSHSIPKYRNDPCILCSESGKETCDSCKGKGSVSTTVYYY